MHVFVLGRVVARGDRHSNQLTAVTKIGTQPGRVIMTMLLMTKMNAFASLGQLSLIATTFPSEQFENRNKRHIDDLDSGSC